MWIRSQDRTDLIDARVVQIYTCWEDGNFDIVAITNEDLYPVGTYETRERALEVLRDFEASIAGYEFVKSTGQGLDTLLNGLNEQQRISELISLFIFQMPEE